MVQVRESNFGRLYRELLKSVIDAGDSKKGGAAKNAL